LFPSKKRGGWQVSRLSWEFVAVAQRKADRLRYTFARSLVTLVGLGNQFVSVKANLVALARSRCGSSRSAGMKLLLGECYMSRSWKRLSEVAVVMSSGRVSFAILAALVLWLQASPLVAAESTEKLRNAVAAIKGVQAGGGGNEAASEAVRELSELPAAEVVEVLDAFSGASPLAKNWLMGVVGAIAQKNGKLPEDSLLAFLADSSRDADARYWVFEYLTGSDAALREKMLAAMTNDSSLDIRYLAIEQALKKLEDSAKKEGADPQAAKSLGDSYRKLFDEVRHPEQLKTIAAKLRELGDSIDVSRQYGFLMSWSLVGPFDNRNQASFDVVYAPEKNYLTAPGTKPEGSFEGKEGKACSWMTAQSDSDEGMLDIAALYDKEKGAIVYAYTEFLSADDVEVDVRLGCINANKVWVNGKEVLSNEVYHAASSIDQYVGRAALKKGRNTILVKVCQNEQTEAWAQDWKFQLRICDSTGKAILATDRPVAAAAGKSDGSK
jgi:hypothetical protein